MYNNIIESDGALANGSISLDETLNDYPTLTIVSQQEDTTKEVAALGSVLTYKGLTFYLETLSINKVPLNELSVYEEITYVYSHVSKRVLEHPIRLRDFVEGKHSLEKGTKKDTYVVSIASLAAFASTQVPYGKVFTRPYTTEISKNPSADETITLRSIIDDNRRIYGHVVLFSGDYAYTAKLATGAYIPSAIINNYTISRGLIPAYRNSVLTWDNVDRYDERNKLERKRFRRAKYVEYMTYEGDHNPQLPPRDINFAPRDLSIMVDNSGLTKQCKITKYRYDQPDVEIEAVFGYAHCALELVADPSRPNNQTSIVTNLLSNDILTSGNAYQEVLGSIASGQYGYPDDANFVNPIVWRLISLKEKVYNYEPLNLVVSPRVKQDGSYIDVKVAPGYARFKRSYAEVLISEETRGWELKRFASEDPTNWAKGSIQAWNQLVVAQQKQANISAGNFLTEQELKYNLYYAKILLEQYLFRRIPLYERIDYAIEPFSRYYTDADKIDWEVEILPRSEVTGTSSSESEVAVLYPSPEWAPSLMVNSRSRYKTSVGLSGNPDYKLFSRNYYGSNPLTVTTGSEEFEYTKYGILPSKSTKKSLRNSYEEHTDITALLDSMTNQLTASGTHYTPHSYMTISDYGVKGIEIPEVNPYSVVADLPSAKGKKEDRFVELTVLHNASDNSYKSKIATRTYSLNQGRPPNAVLRFPVFTERDTPDEEDNNGFEDTITLITSPGWRRSSQIIPSVSAGSAQNVQEAINVAKFDLEMEYLNANTVSATLMFKPFFGRCISNNTTIIDGVDGTWVVKRASHVTHYTDGVALVQPISIEAGLYTPATVISRTLPDASKDDSNTDDKGDVTIEANLPKRFGISYDQVPDNFARWVDV